jgi:hypothetical protein
LQLPPYFRAYAPSRSKYKKSGVIKLLQLALENGKWKMENAFPLPLAFSPSQACQERRENLQESATNSSNWHLIAGTLW